MRFQPGKSGERSATVNRAITSAMASWAKGRARSPAATLIAADPTTRANPGTHREPFVQGRTRFPIRSEIRLFNTADTNCYLKVASASPCDGNSSSCTHSDATTTFYRRYVENISVMGKLVCSSKARQVVIETYRPVCTCISIDDDMSDKGRNWRNFPQT